MQQGLLQLKKEPSLDKGTALLVPEEGALPAALPQQFEYRLRLNVGLSEHSHRGLNQDLDNLLGLASASLLPLHKAQ